MENEDAIDRLNLLIETCRDGEMGFRTCAEHVRSPALKAAFSQRVDDCREGAAQLQAEVARLGGHAESSGSTTGALHRGWVNLKGVLGGSDLAMLEECERGEDAALARYRDALKRPLPAETERIVRIQYEGVKRNHHDVRALRDAEKERS